MIDLPPRIDLLLCKYALFLSTRAQRCTVEIRYLDHMSGHGARRSGGYGSGRRDLASNKIFFGG